MNPDLLPMLAGRSYQMVPTTGFRASAEPKLDGWRAIIHVREDEVVVYGGRNGSVYTGRVPYIEEALSHLPADTVLDGELVSRQDWGMVQSIMTTQQPHVPSKLSPPVNFYVFDMLRLSGHDMRNLTWKQRRRFVDSDALYQAGELIQPTLLLEPTNEMLSWALSRGYEGLVLKDPGSSYVNKRSNSWAKVKPQQTVDARIVGFKPGKLGGAYEGMVGSFEVELLDSGVKTTLKCGVDARHVEATEHPERWLYSIIEIKHHGLSRTGVPRHPQFSRRRLDLERRAG